MQLLREGVPVCSRGHAVYRGQLARRDTTKGAGRESGVLRRGHRDEAELPVLPPRPLAAARRPRQVCSRLPVARAVAVAVAARWAATVGVWVGIHNLLLCRKRGGSGLCPPALRRLLSALDRAASSGQPRPISRAWAAPAGHVGPVFDVAASCSPASSSGSPAASAYKEPTGCMWRARPCRFRRAVRARLLSLTARRRRPQTSARKGEKAGRR